MFADLTGQRSSITVTGFDRAGQRVAEAADNRALTAELVDLESGATVLHRTLGDRIETVTNADPLDRDEARARAEGAFRRSGRRFVSGFGIAPATAKLRVAATVRLEGLGPPLSGHYYVAEVSHRFDIEGGMRTHFRFERPGLGRPP